MNWKSKKIGVLMGGCSSEREISLKTGNAIYNSLKRTGYNAVKVDIKSNSIEELLKNKFDVAYIALHGRYGEDGIIQGILEFLNIPYTGTGVTGSALCMDKVLSKRFFRELGVPTANFSTDSPLDIDFPLVVKPVSEGSTIGVFIVNNKIELEEALENAKKVSDNLFFEEYIKGREVTVGVVNGKALPVVEIKPKSGFYDYKAKYEKGFTEYVVPAELENSIAEMLKNFSEKIYKNFNLKGAVRVDYIIRDATPYALEVNTIPGMTETSLLPKAANCAGISFDALVEEILRGI
jgi:D-alanine-D-alanine ligase